ncbi:hypothetical protein KR767_02510 [Luteibacter anthropi]|uniref:RHS repeat-associated core domain-containing protein n=1 Tax=Luteibacter anthropi TaxID=564369 RepID=UPI0020330075|nr:RHS repeat-associated core domain-containing protein [Luteibacter anthropi]URX62962.1 hypothetical protein KR767_02510 [Luteibacter anthropi]
MDHNAMGTDPCDSQNDAIFNTTTQKRTHVDPRTGLFEALVPLPKITGNAGQGPVMDLSLYYSPVVNNMAALGDGWSFAVTTWYEKNDDLTLHTGEVIDVKKGATFKNAAVKITWTDNNTTMTVERTDGRVETLKKQGSSQIWVPVKFTTDGYRYLNLTWVAVAQTVAGNTQYQIRLTAINDDGATDASGKKAAARRLLTINYRASATGPADDQVAAPTDIRLNFWPGTTEAMTYTLNLNAQYALTSIEPPEYGLWKAEQDRAKKPVGAADGPKARFAYQEHATCGWLLNDIVTFEGLRQSVTYADNGLKFPGNEKLSALPCVARHTITPRGEGDATTADYSYFWQDDDKRYKLTGSWMPNGYQTEIVQGNRKTIHVYTSSHAESEEITVTDEKTITISHPSHELLTPERKSSTSLKTYKHIRKEAAENYVKAKTDKEKSKALADEKMTRASISYIRFEDGRSPLKMDVSSRTAYAYASSNPEFDDTNPTKEIGVFATLTKNDFISLYFGEMISEAGSSLHPNFFSKPGEQDDPSSLQAGMVIPPTLAQGSIETIDNRQTIVAMIEEDESCITYWKDYNYHNITGLNRKKIETTKQACGPMLDATLIQKTTWWEDDDFRKGLKKSITQGNNDADDDGNENIVAGTGTSLAFAYELNDDQTELTTTTTETRSGISRTTRETVSTLSGRLIEQLDADNNKATYAYDAHGRLVTHVVCAQSPTYAETTTFAYPSPGRVEITDPDGQKHASEHDGGDQPILEQVWHADTSAWRNVKTITYDALGRESVVREFDYLADGTALESTCTTEYDDWGEACHHTYSDGRKEFNEYDPIDRVREEWSGTASDKQRKRTTYNLNGSVAKVESVDTNGDVTCTDTYAYRANGWLLGLSRVTPHGTHTTTYGYDAIGRVTREAHDEDGSTYAYDYEYPTDWLINEPTKRTVTWDSTTRTLGERTFDAWGRCTSLTRAGITETYTYSGATPVPATKTHGDGTSLTYTTIPEMGHQPKIVTQGTLSQAFSYLHGNTRTSSATEGAAKVDCEHDINERVTKQTTTVRTGVTRTVERSYTSAGRLLSDNDGGGNAATYTYNTQGQRVTTVAGNVTTTHAYDAQGRLASDTIVRGADTVTVTYSYDSEGKETSRRFQQSGTGGFDYTLTHSYFGDDRIDSVEWKDGSTSKGKRSYTYTASGCIKSCRYTGDWQPKTPGGKTISQQDFTVDGLGNVTACTTTFDGGSCTSSYTYDDTSGCRLSGITHSHADYPAATTPVYDKNGRITKDITGKTYTYDWLGRLTQAGSRYYTYTPLNGLSATGQGNAEHHLVYDGTDLRSELKPDNDGRWLAPGSAGCTVQTVKRSGVLRILFELRDIDGTVLLTFDATAKTPKYHTYTAWGAHSSTETDSLLGFKGEYRDHLNDQYPLGCGYRSYHPDGMQFGVPDDWSPFGDGGPQSHGCFDGDPANMADPSGHMAVGSGAVNRGLRRIWGDTLPGPLGMGKGGGIFKAIIWGALGVLTAALTGGASLLITAALVGLAAVSAGLGIAAAILEDSNPELAKALSWASLATGLAGGLTTLGKKVAQLALKLGRSGIRMVKELFQKGAAAGSRLLNQGRNTLSRLTGRALGSSGTRAAPKGSGYAGRMLGSPRGATPSVGGAIKDRLRALTNDAFYSTWTEHLKAFDLDDFMTVVSGYVGRRNAKGLSEIEDGYVSTPYDMHNLAMQSPRVTGSSFLGRLFSMRFR